MSDTFFQSGLGGGGSAGSGEFVKDSFSDTTLAATNNTGIGSSLTTNPVGAFLGDTDCPQYRQKTLMITGVKVVEDRSKWINGSATYEIIFDQYFPGVFAYATGSPRILKTQFGTCLNIQFVGDIIGVNAKAVRMAWIIAPVNQTATSAIFTDGSDTTRTATYGSSVPGVNSTGYNSGYKVFHQAVDESDSLHDFRLVTNQFGALNVIGIEVYFNNGADQVVCPPGSSYVDKTKSTTSLSATLAAPSAFNEVGYRASIFKTDAGLYGVTTASFGGSLTTFGAGSSGGTSLDVSTGTGSSFPIGTGVVIPSGTSFYAGVVSGVSTDTLTIGPALPFGFSGQVHRAWRGGQSLAIESGYELKRSLDVPTLTDPGQVQSFGWGVTTAVFFSDRRGDFRITGQNLMPVSTTSVPAIGNVGGTLGILQFDGRFSAMGLEFASNGYIQATLSINGIPSHSIAAGATGIFSKSVMTGGPGWKSVRVAMGASNFSAISKINLYEFLPGATLGVLGSFDLQGNAVIRYGVNATMMGIGPFERIYADQMYLTGPWVRQANASAAGGIEYVGSTTTCTFLNRYIGSNYGFVGHGAGASIALTLNGGSVGSSFGYFYTGVSVGFNTLSGSVLGGTAIIQALDIQTQNSRGEIGFERTTEPLPAINQKNVTYKQSDTPRQAKDGDIWLQNQVGGAAWLKAWGRWYRLQVADSADDPNASAMWTTGGTVTTAASGAVGSVQAYNFSAWSTAQPSDTVTSSVATGNESAYQNTIMRAGGFNSAGTVVGTVRSWNKIAHSSLDSMPGIKCQAGGAQAYGYFYHIAGYTSGDSNVTYRYNGSWSTATANNSVRRDPCTGVVNNVIYSMLGRSGGGGLNTVDTRNSADAVAAGTNTNVNTSDFCMTGGRVTDSLMAYICSSTDTARCQSYNGSAFSASSYVATNAGYGYQGYAAGFPSRSLLISCPGQNAGASATSNLTNTFNGVATGTAGTMPLSLDGAAAGAI